MSLGRVAGSIAALSVAATAVIGIARSAPPGAADQAVTESDAMAMKRIKSTDDFQVHSGPRIDPATAPGRPLFEEHCAMCHLGGVPKAPSPTFLGMLAPDAIVSALTDGIMKAQGSALTPPQRIQVAEYLTRTPYNSYSRAAPPAQCKQTAIDFTRDIPQPIGWGLDNRRFVPGPVAALDKAKVPQLKLKWAFAYPAATKARSQPTVAWNTLFVGSQDGAVYAFDPDSGCLRWMHRGHAEVRTGIVADARAKRLYYGDLLGRAHALDAATGKELWSVKVSDHADATITGTPTLGGGRLYVPVSSLEVAQAGSSTYACCTFRGSVLALDPATGKELWRAWTVQKEPSEQARTANGTAILGPSGAPVWNSPTYDAKADRIYFGSGENYSSPADDNSDAMFAVDAKTGKRIWHTQLTKNDAWNVGCMLGTDSCPKEKGPDFDLAASVLNIPLPGGKHILVGGQKSGEAWGVAPDTGKIVWHSVVGHGGTQGGVHFGMAAEGSHVFVPVNDMADTGDARVYDVKLRGSGLHALDAATGKQIWWSRAADDCSGAKFCDPGISSAVTAIPGVVFAGHLDGKFRAYDAATGKILWQVDTTKPVRTITGETGKGGSMSGPGATVWKGHVIVNSGYGMYSHMAGNLLMVFAAN
jgi:polyvinyl alcohol dehydrogenase (cytochrome)